MTQGDSKMLESIDGKLGKVLRSRIGPEPPGPRFPSHAGIHCVKIETSFREPAPIEIAGGEKENRLVIFGHGLTQEWSGNQTS